LREKSSRKRQRYQNDNYFGRFGEELKRKNRRRDDGV
jgi:hypothetical protein